MRSSTREHVQVDMVEQKWEAFSEFDNPTESQIIERIKNLSIAPREGTNRYHFSVAFDPIAVTDKAPASTSSGLDASIFDGTLSILAVDVAPFVRTIVTSDSKIQEERFRLSNLMSEGGRKGKRMRTTRAAMSALEGGQRNTTRKDRYFGNVLNAKLVQRTGGEGWQEAASATIKLSGSYGSTRNSREATPLKQDDTDEIPESSQ